MSILEPQGFLQKFVQVSCKHVHTEILGGARGGDMAVAGSLQQIMKKIKKSESVCFSN